jgi:murein DD-endopeptidase MepM/ murein hydrolase activator NlpD
MTPPAPRLLRTLLLVLGTVALSLPASSLAGEVLTTTTPAPPPVEGTTTSTQPAPTATSEAPTASTPTTTPSEAEPVAPQVQAQHSQGSSAGAPAAGHAKHKGKSTQSSEGGEANEGASAEGPRAKHKAVSPSTLTPALPLDLRSSISGVPSFFIESFQIPPFLLPIFQAAGTAYGIPWQVLAAINEVETDYGRDLSVSSAGAEGWMQFLPSEWAQYGVDANGAGYEDPYNPADAIFAAARYLRAAGGDTNIKAAVYSYNHSQAYVEAVLLRAQLLGGTPSELLGAITGLTEARFPVYAASHFSDGFQTTPEGKTLVGTTIYAQTGAPVIAVEDGEITQTGESPSLGHYISLRDAYGNTYTYAQLGDVSSVYPVLEPVVHTTVSRRISGSPAHESAPGGPATAGAQPRSPVTEGAAISGLALGAAASLEPAPSTPAAPPVQVKTPVTPPAPAKAKVGVFREGANEVYLRPLSVGVQVIAGTVLGHVGPATGAGTTGVEASPHILFQLRPAGLGAPLIDPKPILDGWVDLENTSIFRAKGENPFLATSPTVGQVLLESKQQLEPQVLRDGAIHLGKCARQDVQEGRVDKRVLAVLEYLSVSGLKPTVSGLRCSGATTAQEAAYAPASASSEAVDITAVNGMAIAGHQGAGSITDTTVRKLLMLQGVNRPQKIVSLTSYPGAAGAEANPDAADYIRIAFGASRDGSAHSAGLVYSGLAPSEWVKLISRLGEIPDPSVSRGPSSAAIPDGAATAAEGSEG